MKREPSGGAWAIAVQMTVEITRVVPQARSILGRLRFISLISFGLYVAATSIVSDLNYGTIGRASNPVIGGKNLFLKYCVPISVFQNSAPLWYSSGDQGAGREYGCQETEDITVSFSLNGSSSREFRRSFGYDVPPESL